MSNEYCSVIKSTNNKPNTSVELTELLNRLDLSSSVLLEKDALAIDQNSSSSSRSGSIRNADTGNGYPEQFSTTNSAIDRQTLLNELSMAKTAAEVYLARNGFFHGQLVEHFKRKQMMRVYGEPNEEDSLRNKYLKKLTKYEQIKQELQAAEEEFKAEVTLLREDLCKKMEQADADVEELVAKQRAAGALAFANGKQLPAKDIQTLITRELGKMKEISKIRIRYARLRDSLVEKEVVFDALNTLTPNLDRKDYERLEAENFYYKHELKMKEEEDKSLTQRRGHLSIKLKLIRRKRIKLSRIIQQRRDTFEGLKKSIKKMARRKQIRKRKIEEINQYFENVEPILSLRIYPEVRAKMNDLQNQRKEWFEKVAKLISEIKENDRCLKSLGVRKTFREQKQKSVDEDSDESTSYPQKSRRPPLGGGFLQAL